MSAKGANFQQRDWAWLSFAKKNISMFEFGWKLVRKPAELLT